jgi:hypothetical protein
MILFVIFKNMDSYYLIISNYRITKAQMLWLLEMQGSGATMVKHVWTDGVASHQGLIGKAAERENFPTVFSSCICKNDSRLSAL